MNNDYLGLTRWQTIHFSEGVALMHQFGRPEFAFRSAEGFSRLVWVLGVYSCTTESRREPTQLLAMPAPGATGAIVATFPAVRAKRSS